MVIWMPKRKPITLFGQSFWQFLQTSIIANSATLWHSAKKEPMDMHCYKTTGRKQNMCSCKHFKWPCLGDKNSALPVIIFTEMLQLTTSDSFSRDISLSLGTRSGWAWTSLAKHLKRNWALLYATWTSGMSITSLPSSSSRVPSSLADERMVS